MSFSMFHSGGDCSRAYLIVPTKSGRRGKVTLARPLHGEDRGSEAWPAAAIMVRPADPSVYIPRTLARTMQAAA